MQKKKCLPAMLILMLDILMLMLLNLNFLTATRHYSTNCLLIMTMEGSTKFYISWVLVLGCGHIIRIVKMHEFL